MQQNAVNDGYRGEVISKVEVHISESRKFVGKAGVKKQIQVIHAEGGFIALCIAALQTDVAKHPDVDAAELEAFRGCGFCGGCGHRRLIFRRLRYRYAPALASLFRLLRLDRLQLCVGGGEFCFERFNPLSEGVHRFSRRWILGLSAGK